MAYQQVDNNCRIDEVVACMEGSVRSQDHPQHLVAFLEVGPKIGVVVACAPSVDLSSASDFWAFGLEGRIGMFKTSILLKVEVFEKSLENHTHIHFKNRDNASVNQKLSQMRSNEFHGFVHTSWIAKYFNNSIVLESKNRQIFCRKFPGDKYKNAMKMENQNGVYNYQLRNQ